MELIFKKIKKKIFAPFIEKNWKGEEKDLLRQGLSSYPGLVKSKAAVY